MTPIPLASKNVKGLINLRGQIVTVLSKNPETCGQNIIVIKKDQDLIGLEVDSVDSIVDLADYKLSSHFKFDVLSNDKEILVFIKDIKDLFSDLSI
jgi:chemotaxis signal transduction protein